VGQPSLATPAKGKIVFDAVVEALARLVEEFRSRPRRSRVDLH